MGSEGAQNLTTGERPISSPIEPFADLGERSNRRPGIYRSPLTNDAIQQRIVIVRVEM